MAGLLSIGFNSYTLWGIAAYITAFVLFIIGGFFARLPIGGFILKLSNIIAIPLLIIGSVLLFGANLLINIFNNPIALTITIGIAFIILVYVMLFILPKKQKDVFGGL